MCTDPTDTIDTPFAATPELPDWGSIDRPVPCPLCGYELRGLPEPRCPECGGRFEWAEVLDPKRQEHPYLFEHHPERGLWSFRRTALGALRPRRFWTSLHPAQPSRLARLLLYWLLSAVILVAASLSFVVSSGATNARGINTARQELLKELERRTARALAELRALPNSADYIAQFEQQVTWERRNIDRMAPPTSTWRTIVTAWRNGWLPGEYFRLVAPSLVILPPSWPWLTFLGLLVFRWSMRRARVRRVHLLRCAIYSFDPALLAVLCVLAAGTSVLLSDVVGSRWTFMEAVFLHRVFILPIVLWLILSWLRFTAAIRHYLQFDHPRSTALAVQIMVVMAELLPLPGVVWQVLRLVGIFA